ncbi:MAG: ABC-2 family transporter protein [Eubacteriales bacterium]|nr:ABC-2 family transporter protein [Eubacteriales bacterium]
MKRIAFAVKMYGLLLRTGARSMAQYRADFWIGFAGVVLLNAANLVQLGVVSWRFQSVDGWSAAELMVLYGMCMVSWSLYSIFFKNLNNLESEILSGAFDRYLLRPVSPFLQLVGGDVRYTGLCDTLLGLALVICGCAGEGARWGVGQCLWFVLLVLCGGAIMVCIQTMISCAAFWIAKSSALRSITTHVYMLVQRYPISIFGAPLRVLVTAILPVAFLNYYPASFLLGKATEPPWLAAASPLVAVVFALLARLMWKKGLRRYNGAGG